MFYGKLNSILISIFCDWPAGGKRSQGSMRNHPISSKRCVDRDLGALYKLLICMQHPQFFSVIPDLVFSCAERHIIVLLLMFLACFSLVPANRASWTSIRSSRAVRSSYTFSIRNIHLLSCSLIQIYNWPVTNKGDFRELGMIDDARETVDLLGFSYTSKL